MILTNGKLYGRPEANTLVLEDERLAAVGAADAFGSDFMQSSEMVDLQGRTVLPGFIDSHVHLFGTGLTQSGWRLDLAGLSREDALESIAQAAGARDPCAWIVATGWDEGMWKVKDYLSRAELDRISKETPLVAVRMDGHLLVVNGRGLAEATKIVPNDLLAELADSESGEIREAAAWHLLESIEPDAEALDEALRAAAAHAHRLGVTSVHAMMPRRRVPALLRAGGRDRLRVCVYHRVSSAEEVEEIRADAPYDGKWIRFGGVKAFADGSIGAKNAALATPYIGGGTGVLNHADEDIISILERSETAGWPTAIHAIGDRAIEQVLRSHEHVGTSSDLKHRMEHAELATQEQISRARNLGITLSMQPNFIGNWSGLGSMNERRLGRIRDEVSEPLGVVLQQGASLAFGSDGMPISPLYGIHSTVNAPYDAQRVSVEDAVRCYTEAGARLSFEEDVKGRLEAGFLADLVVLDDEVGADPKRIAERVVDRVFVGGECVYQRVSEEE